MKVVKWILGVLGAIVILLAIAAFVVKSKGEAKLAMKYPMEYDEAVISSDSASLALGKYLAESHGCQKCHGMDYSGTTVIDAPPFLVNASNLTAGKGGVGSQFTDGDWLRAVRHGVGGDGRGLLVMPSEAYYHLNDQEVGALIAYLKQVNPVDNELARSEFRILGKLIVGMSDDMKLAPDMMLGTPRLQTREKGPTVEWGEYRASVLCQVCHGVGLTGGQPPDPESPPAPDLRTTQSWGLEGFMRALREGVTPSNKELNPEMMPWEATSHLDDIEIEALYKYISTL